jgi:hypothetical protein
MGELVELGALLGEKRDDFLVASPTMRFNLLIDDLLGAR